MVMEIFSELDLIDNKFHVEINKLPNKHNMKKYEVSQVRCLPELDNPNCYWRLKRGEGVCFQANLTGMAPPSSETRYSADKLFTATILIDFPSTHFQLPTKT